MPRNFLLKPAEYQKLYRSGWPAAVLGALPILSLGAAVILSKWGPVRPAYSYSYWVLLWNMVLVVGFAAGWIKGFPRWSLGFLALALVFDWWWADMTTAGWQILGHSFQTNEHWQWRAWAPFCVAAIGALWWTRSLKPLSRLVRSIYDDWTLATFALYNMAAWLFIVAAYDENHHPQLLLYVLGSTIVLSGGSFFYMLAARKWQRVMALLFAFTMSVIIEAGANQAYWSTRMELGWSGTIWGQALLATAYAAVMCAPFLLTLWRRRHSPTQPA